MKKTKRTDYLSKPNVFVLNTGRCGSTTFIKACMHIDNYTCGHETLSRMIGDSRLDYPKGHIEADNRLSWFLGKLDVKYGDNAIYVHLLRDPEDTARSYIRRYPSSIVKAYRQAILMGGNDRDKPYAICRDYIDTVNINIERFLKDKSNKMIFRLEDANQDFRQFWSIIEAEGDLPSALMEFSRHYNRSKSDEESNSRSFINFSIILRKIFRLLRNLPNYIKNA